MKKLLDIKTVGWFVWSDRTFDTCLTENRLYRLGFDENNNLLKGHNLFFYGFDNKWKIRKYFCEV